MRKLSFRQKMAKQFEPREIATTKATIGDIGIDPVLNVNKIKEALKKLMSEDNAAFARVRDFDWIVSDQKAKEYGVTVPSDAAAWYNSAYPDTMFIKKDVVNRVDAEELARIMVHEHRHKEMPMYGEWTAEEAAKKAFQ